VLEEMQRWVGAPCFERGRGDEEACGEGEREGGERRKHAGRERGRRWQHQEGEREREEEEKRVRVKMDEDSKRTDVAAILAIDQQSSEDMLH
jgi:hypothetical protein